MNNILLVFYWLIISIEILCGFWNLFKTFITLKKISFMNNYDRNNKFSDFKILIVIPCLREQSIIKETIDYFVKLIKNNDKIDLVIVTTEKEEYEKSLIKSINQSNDKTTFEVVNEYIYEKNLKKVKLFHYPNKAGMMADQLNYVIEQYNSDNFSKIYFSVYNADSRPNLDTLNSVLKTIEEQKPKVMQQYSYAFSNLNNLSFIMKGFALYQSNFEIKYGLVNALTFPKFLYTYIVGHGLYIRFDVLKRIGGFDNKFWCEDIYLSSVLRNREIEITPVLSLENMETPKRLSILIKQNANWFRTSSQWIRMLKTNLSSDKKISNSGKIWFFQRVRMNLSWLLLPYLIILPCIISIYIKNIILFSVSIVSYLFMQLCIYMSTLKTIENMENKKIKNKFILICAVCISTFISNIGPLYSLFNVKMKKYKTER